MVCTRRSFVPRGGVDGDDELGAFVGEFLNGIALITAALPKLLVIPAVFADGNGDFFAAQMAEFLGGAGQKIAGFVENVVIGQEHFDLLEDDFAMVDDGGGVLGADGGAFGRVGDVAEDEGGFEVGALAGDGFKGGGGAVEEGLLLDQIARGVAGEGEFGKDDGVGLRLVGFSGEIEDFCGVRFEVSHGVINLCEGEAHGKQPL